MALLVMELQRHMEEPEIERYSMRQMPEDESAAFEEHLLTCETCRQRVLEHDEYISTMRRAASKIVAPPAVERTSRPFGFMWVFAAATVVVAVLLFSGTVRPQARVEVSLYAMRGPAAAQAPSNAPLAITPDLTGLPPSSAYRVELVDLQGKKLSTGDFRGAPVPMPRLSPGIYFVRLYSQSGELLREYGLETVSRK